MSSDPDAPNIFDKAIFGKAIAEHLEVVRRMEAQAPVLEAIATAMTAALRAGGKILWCGNGGSAADSQHLAAELVGVLTSVANDYGFEAAFARQVDAIGNAGDVLVGISTSGNSRNVIAALETARAQGIVTVAFTGEGGGRIGAVADHVFAVDSRDTARIQEAHILAGHMLCDCIELASVSAPIRVDGAAKAEAAR